MASQARTPVGVSLRRDLGLFDVTMIGVGAMIGSSIFVLAGTAVGIAGPAVLLAFLLNLGITVFTAIPYARMGAAMPEAGGGYLWARRAFGGPVGFLSGWMSWFGHTVACAFYAIALGIYAEYLLEELNALGILTWAPGSLEVALHFGPFSLGDWSVGPWTLLLTTEKWFAAAVILFFVAVNYVGVSATGKTGNLVTLVQVLILVFFIAFGLLEAVFFRQLPLGNLEPFFGPAGGFTGPSGVNAMEAFQAVLTAMGFTFIAFQGYEIIVQTGEEVRNPSRNIPRAIYASILIVTAIYVLTVLVALLNAPAPAWIFLGDVQNGVPGPGSETTLISVAKLMMIGFGGPLILGAGLFSAMAALNATIFSSSRVSFAMGRDGSLPSAFGRIHPERRTPHLAVVITGAIMLTMAFMFNLAQIVAAAAVLFLLLFSIANAATLRLRGEIRRASGGRADLHPAIPSIGIIFKGVLAVTLFFFQPVAWYIAITWILIGLFVHAVVRPAPAAIPAPPAPFEAPRALTPEELERYRVFLALSDLGDLRLVEIASIFARGERGNLTINTIVEVPLASPLDSVPRQDIETLSDGLEKVSKIVNRTVDVRPVVSVSHDVAASILESLRTEFANLLVLGWKGRPGRTQGTILGRNLDAVVRNAPCDVAIVKTRRLARGVEKILVVSGAFSQSLKAMRLAVFLAKEYGAKIEILTVLTDERTLELMRGNAERLGKLCEHEGVDYTTVLIRSKSLVNAVVMEARDAGMLVLGVGRRAPLEHTMFGPAVDKILQMIACPVVVLRTAHREEPITPHPGGPAPPPPP